MKSLLPCLIIASLAPYSSGSVFVSPLPFGNGASDSTPSIDLNVGDSQTLYVYWNGGSVSDGFSLDVSPSQAEIIGFTGSETIDFSLNVIGNQRWDGYAGAASGPQAALTMGVAVPLLGDVDLSGVVDFFDIAPFEDVLSSGGFQAEADADMSGAVDFLDIAAFGALLPGSGFTVDEANLLAFAVTGSGINPTFSSFDPGYDATANAFLVGSFDFEALALGTTTLSTSAGIAQIVNNGVALSPSFGTANINVIPEPGVGLLASSSVCFLLLRRRKSKSDEVL